MITIDSTSPTPPFEQLREQLAADIRSGELTAGAKLPTVRGLADDLGLAPNTVARAYRELEEVGIIETRGRNGSFVAWSSDGAQRQAEEAARSFAERILALGVDGERALELVRRALSAG